MPKILLIEDHEEIWDFLSRRLKRRGFDIVLAHDGQDGLDKVRAERPDVVLLDMNLPVMDGWTVARHLKSDAATARIPVIALADREATSPGQRLAAEIRQIVRTGQEPEKELVAELRRIAAAKKEALGDAPDATGTAETQPAGVQPASVQPNV